MSTITSAIFAESEALQELAKLYEGSNHTKAETMRIIEFMRKASQSATKLYYPILILTGLPNLLVSPYTEDTNPIPLLRSALSNLSRETTLIIEVDKLEWSPSNRTNINAEGKNVPVSEIDIHGTTVLKSRIRMGASRGRRKDNFIKVNW
jgi:hypothetical protein